MTKKSICKSYKWLYLSIALALLDINTKYWVKTYFVFGEIFQILPGINIYYTCNSGLVLGLFSGINIFYKGIFLWIVILTILMFITILCLLNKCTFIDNFSYSMIIGGALGNLYDRILYGTVVDFIDLYIGKWHWPTFNIADLEIFIGIAILSARYYYNSK